MPVFTREQISAEVLKLLINVLGRVSSKGNPLELKLCKDLGVDEVSFGDIARGLGKTLNSNVDFHEVAPIKIEPNGPCSRVRISPSELSRLKRSLPFVDFTPLGNPTRSISSEQFYDVYTMETLVEYLIWKDNQKKFSRVDQWCATHGIHG